MKRTIYIGMLALLACTAAFSQEIAEKEATTDTVSSDIRYVSTHYGIPLQF